MKFAVPKNLRSYVLSPQVDCGVGGNRIYEVSELFLLGLTDHSQSNLVNPGLYRRVTERAPECMPYFLEQVVPFPVLAIPAAEMSDWGAVVEAKRVSEVTRTRFVLFKQPALRGVFGTGEAAVTGLGGTILLDLALALRTLPLDDSWVQTSLLPPEACAFQTAFVGSGEYLGLRAINQFQAARA